VQAEVLQSAGSLMPYADPEKRRANWAKNRERNRQKLRASYAKHREKRLAAKRAEYLEKSEEMRQRNRRQYAKNAEKRVQYARAYRAANADIVNARALERYYRDRDKINERGKGYRERNYEKIYARIERWRKAHPERVRLYGVKTLIKEATGMRYSDIPDDLAEAKALQLEIARWVREASRENAPSHLTRDH
jgi:hypothetical protein